MAAVSKTWDNYRAEGDFRHYHADIHTNATADTEDVVTFSVAVDKLHVQNSGAAALTATVGETTKSIQPGAAYEWEAAGITQLTIQSSLGYQHVIVDGYLQIAWPGAGIEATAAEVNVLADVTAGTAAAGKAVVLGADKSIGSIASIKTVKLLVGAAGAEVELVGLGAKSNNVLKSNDCTVYDDGGAIDTSGIALVTGGTGIADLTLDAPTVGCRCEIRIDSLSSGSVVVTAAEGVTFDGENNTATFDAAGEALILAYKSATEWQIVENVGSVALSDV